MGKPRTAKSEGRNPTAFQAVWGKPVIRPAMLLPPRVAALRKKIQRHLHGLLAIPGDVRHEWSKELHDKGFDRMTPDEWLICMLLDHLATWAAIKGYVRPGVKRPTAPRLRRVK